jgi:hypothetical protein
MDRAYTIELFAPEHLPRAFEHRHDTFKAAVSLESGARHCSPAKVSAT